MLLLDAAPLEYIFSPAYLLALFYSLLVVQLSLSHPEFPLNNVMAKKVRLALY